MTDPDRYHSLDAVRAFALLGGIALHCTIAFLPGMREGNYPISDDSQSVALSGVFFIVHIFRMSLFFAIAGFFAHVLLVRLGTRSFIKNRLRRIALPLPVGLLVTIPMMIPAYRLAQTQLHLPWPPTIRLPIPDMQPPPWMHLWFLYLLLVLYALTMLARATLVAVDRRGALPGLADRLFAALVASRIGPLIWAAPSAVVLYYTPWWQLWTGIPAPVMGMIPNFPAVLAFGSAFVFGWFLHRQPGLLEKLQRDWLLYLIVAVASSVVAISLIGASSKFYHVELPIAERAAYAVSYNLATWCWMFGLIGAATRFLSRPNATWRYFADASFYMYIVHLPIVYLLAATMIRWPVHWSVKYTLNVTVTMVLLLASYHYLVRSTFVGQFLHGRRYPRAGAAVIPAPSISPG
jgi:peptidoglycan/LPS O-acetylase OafA/YrhL